MPNISAREITKFGFSEHILSEFFEKNSKITLKKKNQ